MLKILTVCLSLFFLCISVFAQQSLEQDLQKSFNNFELVKFNSKNALQNISADNQIKLGSFEISLSVNDLRSSSYRAEENRADGKLYSVEMKNVNTFKGKLKNDEKSWIRLNYDEKGFEGLISTANGEFFLEPGRNFSEKAAVDDYVIYQAKDIKHEVELNCDHHLAEKVSHGISKYSSQAQSVGGIRVLEIATEADFEYVSLLGGSTQANSEILGILNMIDGVYEEQLGLSITVTYQHTWTVQDSYPQAGSMDFFLESFKNYWNSNFPTTAVPRDLAHIWTNKFAFADVNARGVAYVNVVCVNPSFAYSSNGRRNEVFAFNLNYLLGAHEIAHTLNATHAGSPQGCGETVMNEVLSNLTPFNFCTLSRTQVRGFTDASGSCLSLQTNTSPRFDFDGDRKADIAVFRPSNGVWYIANSLNNNFSIFQFGQNGDKPVPADFDGDGKTDAAVYRNGDWYHLKSSNMTFEGVRFGLATDKPVPADFDGDGKADVAIFRPSDGFWHQLRSGSGYTAFQFGANGDIPAPADFDGDGKADVNVFRPTNGVWFRINSVNSSISAAQFGINGDIPLPADFDGDGKSDLAVFRNGDWYVFFSSSNNFGGITFGTNNDVPVPADFDGDGKTDFAVFRPSQGIWYRLNSSNGGFSGVQLGNSSDIPALAR